jgi:DNA modification methylase
MIHVGDCIEVMRGMEAESVDCVVTSPPYFGLRDYGVEGQIGLEDTPQAYTAKMVEVFREVRRVLRPEGTAWLNLGDGYANGGRTQRAHDDKNGARAMSTRPMDGAKPKDLFMLPHRVAIALQDDGWWVRNDHVWHKPNCMPESVRDRCTRAHEYVFQLAKSKKYYFDGDAIAEPLTTPAKANYPKRAKVTGRGSQGFADARGGDRDNSGGFPPRVREQRSSIPGGQSLQSEPSDTRNCRSVWTIPSKPFPEAHFATFPVALAERCILAGCPEGGVVLDPFAGAGTTAVAALQTGRQAVLIELNPDYADIARRRIEAARPKPDLFTAEVSP